MSQRSHFCCRECESFTRLFICIQALFFFLCMPTCVCVSVAFENVHICTLLQLCDPAVKLQDETWRVRGSLGESSFCCLITMFLHGVDTLTRRADQTPGVTGNNSRWTQVKRWVSVIQSSVICSIWLTRHKSGRVSRCLWLWAGIRLFGLAVGQWEKNQEERNSGHDEWDSDADKSQTIQFTFTIYPICTADSSCLTALFASYHFLQSQLTQITQN